VYGTMYKAISTH